MAQELDYSGKMTGKLIEMMLPLLIDVAWKLLKENPKVTRERFQAEVDAGVRKWVESMANNMRQLESEALKKNRDRKSDPETIRRNVEICDLRRSDPKKWSHGRLAKKFGFQSEGNVRLILKDEVKWRRLAADLSSD